MEIREVFRSLEEWQSWARTHRAVMAPAAIEGAVDEIRRNGLIEPYSGQRFSGEEIKITGTIYRETLRAGPLVARHRALLMELGRQAQQGRPELTTRRARIYAPEGMTGFALYMRGRFPKFVGSEYAETENERRQLFPIPVEDLHRLTFPAGSLDLVLSNDVFEHLHNLDVALKECCRVLDDDGIMLATFPFLTEQNESVVRAVIEDGQVRHLLEPQHHRNPIRPEEGSLVFEVPGWSIVRRALEAGFSDAYFAYHRSSKHGVLGAGTGGIFVFCAEKTQKLRRDSGAITV